MKTLSWVRTITILAILFTLCCFATPGALARGYLGRSPTEERPPERSHYWDGTNPFPLQSPVTSDETQSSPDVIDLQAPGRMVVTSYRDGRPDLYLTYVSSDGLRLTNDSATEIMPRLNQGANRIVYASNLNSSTFEIYTLMADGTGRTRLTDNKCDNVSPTWSPDGSRIAFEMNCSGQSNIYIMNMDGSKQTQITSDPDYDGQPTWSPDGSKIAFISRRTGGYRVYTMNVDGSGVTQISNQPYSADPVWSPDGNMILFDADSDQDGWQTLWLMNVDGTNQHEIYRPSSQNVDALASGWSPEMADALFNEIYWVQINGNWYWQSAYVTVLDMRAGNTWLPDYHGEDWYPDWKSTDAQAPATTVQPLPGVVPASFTVRWALDDPQIDDFKNYDIEVKDGSDGPWTLWQKAVTSTSAIFTGIGGHTYYFRSRGRDQNNNLRIPYHWL